jgi:hypothetical protein
MVADTDLIGLVLFAFIRVKGGKDFSVPSVTSCKIRKLAPISVH